MARLTKRHVLIFSAVVLLGLAIEFAYFFPAIRENRRNIRTAQEHVDVLRSAVVGAFPSSQIHVGWSSGHNGTLWIQGKVATVEEATRLREVALSTHPGVRVSIVLGIGTNRATPWDAETDRVSYVLEAQPAPTH